MPVDSDTAFRFMRANYRSGMLDKTGAILGQALGEWMADAGLDMEDVLQRLDGASEDAVDRMNKLVRYVNPLLRLGSNEKILRLQARLLDLPRVRAVSIFIIKRVLGRVLRPVPEPIQAEAAGMAQKELR